MSGGDGLGAMSGLLSCGHGSVLLESQHRMQGCLRWTWDIRVYLMLNGSWEELAWVFSSRSGFWGYILEAWASVS